MTSGSARVGQRRHVAAACALVAVSCIIPDVRFQVRGELVNPGPVRIVEAVPLTDEVNDACEKAADGLSACPLPPPQLPYGFIDQNLCRCPERDGNALHQFDIYVEDPDVDDEGNPTDAIFGVFLLDLPDDTTDPSGFVAYVDLFSPTEEPDITPLGFDSYRDSIERPDPILQNWVVGEEAGVDLCNPTAAEKPERGLHSLRILVTDRPWYRPLVFEDGEIVEDDDGEPQRVGEDMAKIGVPDLPGGASYATADFVFRCGDSAIPEDNCNCVTEQP